MGNFVGELKRRNVFRVAIAYGAVSWLLLQACGLIFEAFDLPHIAMRVVFVLLALGFVPALIFSWAYELTPEGLKRDSDVDPTGSVARVTGRKLDFIIIGVLAATVGLLLVDRFMLSPRNLAAASAAASDASASVSPSIAVLPFLDLSETKDQEYFSDGLSEELLDLLAQVPGLHVAGRTSSFSFKGKGATIADIGKALNVATVLEGSIRKSGDRIRITAQLINVADDFHIWSKTYDRKLTDVFALQDEIAGAVVDALKLKLLPAQRPTVSRHFVPSAEAYDQFLLGRQSSRRRTQAALVGALDAFHRAIALEPNYAAAYTQLAYTEDENAYYATTVAAVTRAQQRALAAADRAVTLDPTLAEAYAARGFLRTILGWDWPGAQADMAKAVALNPDDPRALANHALLLATLGRLPEAIAEMRKSIAIDPLATPSWVLLSMLEAHQGDYMAARQAANRVLAIAPDEGRMPAVLGFISQREGHPEIGRAEILRTPDEPQRLVNLAIVEHELGHAAASQQALDALIAKYSAGWAVQIGQVYGWRGEKDRAFEWLDRAYAQRDRGLTRLKYDSTYHPLQDDPRYKALLKKMGLPE